MKKFIIKIATRKSNLAIKQAMAVKAAIESKYSNLKCELIKVDTKGDYFLNKSLSSIGGKGLFLKELEELLLSDMADIAVHSMKDIPWDVPRGLEVHSVLKREDPRDAFLSLKYDHFFELPNNALVGTSSHRRKGQLLMMNPMIKIMDCRGNLETRLRKLYNGDYDALVLSAAGLRRNNMEQHIKHYFSTNQMIPAVTQGVLAVEIKKSNTKIKEIVFSIQDELTKRVTEAERIVSKSLGADCFTPVAIYCFDCLDKFIIKVGYFAVEKIFFIQKEVEAKNIKEACMRIGNLMKAKLQ